MCSEIDLIKDEIIKFGRLCYDKGYLSGTVGNISVYQSDELILITRSGVHKGLLTRDDIITVDIEGRKLEGEGKPSIELPLHLALYRENLTDQRTFRAVIHAHHISISYLSYLDCSLSEFDLDPLPCVSTDLKNITEVEYFDPGSQELLRAVREKIKKFDNIILKNHGVLVGSEDLLKAFICLEDIITVTELVMNIKSMKI